MILANLLLKAYFIIFEEKISITDREKIWYETLVEIQEN